MKTILFAIAFLCATSVSYSQLPQQKGARYYTGRPQVTVWSIVDLGVASSSILVNFFGADTFYIGLGDTTTIKTFFYYPGDSWQQWSFTAKNLYVKTYNDSSVLSTYRMVVQ